MNNLHIENSYNIWTCREMDLSIYNTCFRNYSTYEVTKVLNRPYFTLYIEWWLHNIGYYLTKPFNSLNHLNLRFKDVDLNEW